jgi:DNA-binding MarR family transcriptional regulator
MATPRPATFYRPATYFEQPSVGLLMKQVVGSVVEQADRELGPHGLTSAQWGPLLHLHKHGPGTVVDLARWMRLDPGAMTRLLDRLEKKGLCQRVRSTADRRVVQVLLTAAGVAAVAEVPGVLCQVMNAHLAGFTRTEWDTLKDLLQRMLDNGNALRQDP